MRLDAQQFQLHRPEDYHIDISRSYRDDGLRIPAGVKS